MIDEHALDQVGDALRGAVAERPDPHGAGAVQTRSLRRRRRRHAVTIATVLVLVVTVASIAAVRREDQQVSTAAAPAADASADTEIRSAVTTLFEPSYSVDEKLAQLDGSGDLRDVIVQGTQDARAPELTLTVTAVDLRGDAATVSIDFFLGGEPALTGATLEMVRVDGHWRAARDSYCALIASNGPLCPGTTRPTPPVDGDVPLNELSSG